MTCPTCGGELTSLYTTPDCISQLSKILECRSCRYPYNRWINVKGAVVNLIDLHEAVRSTIE